MKVLKLFKLGIMTCFCISFQACPGSSELGSKNDSTILNFEKVRFDEDLKFLKEEAQKFNLDDIRDQVRWITGWDKGTVKNWEDFFEDIFVQTIDPIVFNRKSFFRESISRNIVQLGVASKTIFLREKFLFVDDIVDRAKKLYQAGYKDPDIYRIGVSSKEGYGQIYQEVLPLWEFCHAMAQLKKKTDLYILHRSRKHQCKFFGEIQASFTEIKKLVNPLREFCQSVNKIRIQNDKPLILPFEELDTVIKEVSQFAQNFYSQLIKEENKEQVFGEYEIALEAKK